MIRLLLFSLLFVSVAHAAQITHYPLIEGSNLLFIYSGNSGSKIIKTQNIFSVLSNDKTDLVDILVTLKANQFLLPFSDQLLTENFQGRLIILGEGSSLLIARIDRLTPSQSNVPIPSSLPFLGSAIAGLFVVHRKKQLMVV